MYLSLTHSRRLMNTDTEMLNRVVRRHIQHIAQEQSLQIFQRSCHRSQLARRH